MSGTPSVPWAPYQPVSAAGAQAIFANHLPQLPCRPSHRQPLSAFTSLASPHRRAGPPPQMVLSPAHHPWLRPCPSPSAPAHRAGSSPGPSSPSGPLRSGETKAAVSQSGAGRPPQPYPGLLVSLSCSSVAPHPPPPTLPSPVHGFCCSACSPPEGTHLQACGREEPLSRGSSKVSRPPHLPAQPPRPPATALPTSQTQAALGLLRPLSRLAWHWAALPLTWASSLTSRGAEVCGL